MGIKTSRIFLEILPTTDFQMSIKQQILENVEHLDSVFFVQVGSNDGVSGDPLHSLIQKHAHWRGMFIEPVGYLFQRLTLNYNQSSRFIFEQKAIALTSEPLEFYYVSQEARASLGDDFRFWHEQLGSFQRKHILKHFGGKLEPYIVSESIQAVPLSQLLEKHEIPKVDILHVDTEGHDYQVLQTFDFERYQPKIILFEHQHLSEVEITAAHELLQTYEYRHSRYGSDTLAIRKLPGSGFRFSN